MKKGVYLALFLMLIMGGCNSMNNTVEVAKMEGFSKVIVYPSINFSKTEEKVFINAFDKAEKVPGIANIVDPDFQVIIGTENYYLWINEDSGTIMNIKDKQTVYSLSKSSAKKIFDLLNEKYQKLQ